MRKNLRCRLATAGLWICTAASVVALVLLFLGWNPPHWAVEYWMAVIVLANFGYVAGRKM